jgi:four helix bundle protein
MSEPASSKSVSSKSVISKPEADAFIYARRFQDLRFYKECRVLAKEVFVATKKSFPSDEKFSLTDQIRRASRSIGGQLDEAWAKRRYPAHFVSKLTDADGEQQETQHWLTIAFDCGYFSADETRRLGALCLEVGAMPGEMMANPHSSVRLITRASSANPLPNISSNLNPASSPLRSRALTD